MEARQRQSDPLYSRFDRMDGSFSNLGVFTKKISNFKRLLHERVWQYFGQQWLCGQKCLPQPFGVNSMCVQFTAWSGVGMHSTQLFSWITWIEQIDFYLFLIRGNLWLSAKQWCCVNCLVVFCAHYSTNMLSITTKHVWLQRLLWIGERELLHTTVHVNHPTSKPSIVYVPYVIVF